MFSFWKNRMYKRNLNLQHSLQRNYKKLCIKQNGGHTLAQNTRACSEAELNHWCVILFCPRLNVAFLVRKIWVVNLKTRTCKNSKI